MSASRHYNILLPILGLLVGMIVLVAASFPLYQLFCKVTGYGGTTQVAQSASMKVTDRAFTVRFNADVMPELPWGFKPMQKTVQAKAGENMLAYFEATNHAAEPVTGVAVFNVVPDKAGIYFNKVQCFCFDEQTLKPGERVEMPVSFFVDPAIVEDRNLDDVSTITLSYTFFKAEKTKN